jgi:hypothetical protein
VTRGELVALRARAYARKKTPFVWQGRLPGVGLDCLGLVICSGIAAGALPEGFDVEPYTEPPRGDRFVEALREYLDEIPVEEAMPGDVLLLSIKREPRHLAIRTESGMVHCTVEHGLIERPYAGRWVERTHSAYRFR